MLSDNDDSPIGAHIFLPEPDGQKVADIHFTFPHPNIQVDMQSGELAQAISEFLNSEPLDDRWLMLRDPFFGESIYLSYYAISHIAYIGSVWVPHEQIRAQAIKAKLEQGNVAKQQALPLRRNKR